MSETTASAPAASTVTPADSVTPSSARHRRARTALRVVQVLLALFYGIASALPKLIAHPSASEAFDRLGWGSGGMYTIGVLELAGAIALLIPVLQSVAATALGALMVGAFIVQVTAFEGENAATPLILLVPLALIAWARRAANNELWGLVRRGE
ncbi:DoxX family protein [Streptomyces phaeofaciens JCM 4814]|uniref:Membrane protein n=1 Tax=Streptomyces phaeofaciens TaxID=68254 RepID=A0A918HMU2_9ACTN|nr:DoxX family protein [Streptomyces phaeofaciens]GGT82084.1 membrane protein [Streptomyces phaeofaciens]